MTTAADPVTPPTPARPGRLSAQRLARPIFVANVVAQAGIVVTGGLVRITGSGLGCPTWPKCDQNLVVHPSAGIHGAIEFGNRLLTFVLAVVAIACIVVAWRLVPRRRSLVTLAVLTLAGIAVQAGLGGITVLTKLHPATVATHFLVSMVLIWIAVALVVRHRDPGDGPVELRVRREIRLAGHGLLVAGALVLVLGTVVTGSGPHSGDAEHPARFGFDVRSVSWLHADAVVLFVGVVLAIMLGLRLTSAPADVVRRSNVLLVVTLAQGAIGYVQYLTGVPEALVALHLVGACVLWVATLSLWFSMRTRGPVPTA